MTPEQQKTVDDLRDAGYCIIIWTPEEVGEANTGHLGDIVISRGNDFLESYNSEEDD